MVQDTAKRLFKKAGGEFTESGAWKTNTPIKEGVYGVYVAKNKTALVAAFETLNQMMEITQAVDDATSAAGLNDLFENYDLNSMPKSAFLYFKNKCINTWNDSAQVRVGPLGKLLENIMEANKIYDSRFPN